MPRLRRTFAVALIALFLAGCSSTHTYVKDKARLLRINRIAVLPLKCNDSSMGTSIAEALSAELVTSDYAVIERAQLERLLEERHLTIDGIVSGDESFVGKIHGVDALVLGSATATQGWAGLAYGGTIEFVSNCTVRLVDVSSGEVLMAVTYQSPTASTMTGVTTATEIAQKMAKEIAKQR